MIRQACHHLFPMLRTLFFIFYFHFGPRSTNLFLKQLFNSLWWLPWAGFWGAYYWYTTTQPHISGCSHRDIINPIFIFDLSVAPSSNHNFISYFGWIEGSSPCLACMSALYYSYKKKEEVKDVDKKILIQKIYKRFQSLTNISTRLFMNYYTLFFLSSLCICVSRYNFIGLALKLCSLENKSLVNFE